MEAGPETKNSALMCYACDHAIIFLFVSLPMGNAQSAPKHNLYITKVSNMDLPICPFIHTIVGYNSMTVEGIDPLMFRQVLQSQDLSLEILDVRNGSRFKVKIPRGTEKLGINVVKLALVPKLMNIQVTAIRESSSTPLKVGDQILGIEGRHCDTEDEVIYHIKTGGEVKLIVLRDAAAEDIELTSTELGCEIGIGILYKAKNLSYYMKGYNGKIQREYSDTEKENTASGPVGEDGGTTNGESQASDEASMAAFDHTINGPAAEENKECTPSSLDKVEGIQTSSESPVPQDYVLESGNTEDAHKVLPIPPDPKAMLNRNAGSDRTASYVYRPPKSNAQKDQTLDQKNYDRIFSEAGLPKEIEYFGGERMHDKEAAKILNQTLVTREEFVGDEGEERVKDEVYLQRMENLGGIQALFDEEDDDLPFKGGDRHQCHHL